MKKICVVVASRANYGRIRSVLYNIKKHRGLELQIILSASGVLDKYGDLTKLITKDGFKVNKKAYIVVEGGNPITMAKTTGLAVIELSSCFEDLKPDIVLTIADRYETMATAIAATYMNIQLAHTQGGEITGSIDESVRHAITKLAHIHFPATEASKKNLIRLGENRKFIFNTGCPAIDNLKNIKKIKVNDIPRGVGNKTDWSKKFLLVVQHPVTTEFNLSTSQINQTIKAIHKFNVQTVWLWPNIDAGSDLISKELRKYREKNKNHKIEFFKNFEIDHYNWILSKASCLVGNSSSFIREGSFFGTPAVIVGSRQKGREIGRNVILSKNDSNEIYKKIKIQFQRKFKSEKIYGKGNAGNLISKYLFKIKPPIQKNLSFEKK